MFLRRPLLLASTLLVMVAAPRPASAQWWEFIGEMSGPEVMGWFGGCKIDLDNGQWCKDKHVGPFGWGPRLYENGDARVEDGAIWPRLEDEDWPSNWVTVEVGGFVSYGNTPPRRGSGDNVRA